LAVVDTHALVWWHTQADKLGRSAKRLFDRASTGRGTLVVSAMTVVECSEMAQRGRWRGVSFPRWMDALAEAPGFLVAPVTADTVRRSHDCFAVPERGDRLLVATALELGVPLVTRDATIAASGLVRTIW
jgi:PIN domain nuclease of toxin-antitoxin system